MDLYCLNFKHNVTKAVILSMCGLIATSLLLKLICIDIFVAYSPQHFNVVLTQGIKNKAKTML